MVVLLVPAASDCAAVWGFEDAVDRLDGEADGRGDAMASGGGDSTVTGADVGAASDEPAEVDGFQADVTPERLVVDAGNASDAADGADAPDGAAIAEDSGPDAPAQTACSTACVPSPVVPWTGPYEIFEGSGTPPPPLPSCNPGAFPVDVYDGVASPDAPPAACTCTCDSPVGATCSLPVATFFDDGACMQPCGTPATMIGSSCVANLDNCNNWTVGDSAAIGGSCAPRASKTVTPAVWTSTARLCGGASPGGSSDCGGGKVCVPNLSISSTGYCLARAGTGFSCPAAYPVVKTYFGASADTRDCATCSCGGATGISCPGASITGSSDSTCSKNPIVLALPTGCASANYTSAKFFGATPSGGSCPPQGGQASGTFTPTTPTTICCTR